MSDIRREDADRLLAGLGEGELARVLASMRSLVAPVEPRVVEGVAAGMAAAAVSGVVNPLRWLRPRHIWWHKVVASVVTATAASTGGLAATGHLPAPVQRAVSSVVNHVGIDIPDGSSSHPTPIPVPATTTSTSTTTSTTSTSTTTSTTTTTRPCTPARITSATAYGTPAPDAFSQPGRPRDGAALTFTATTSGDVATVVVQEIPGSEPVALHRSGATWTAEDVSLGGPEYVGLPITFTAKGCGTDTRAAPMTRQEP